MTVLTWIGMYFILWWLFLFVVLPFGAKSQADTGEIIEGTDPGAPAILRLWPLLLVNTVLTTVVVALVMWGLSNPFLVRYWS